MMYWKALQTLVEKHQIIIDRPKGSRHPKYADILYPIDYGYLADTTTIDGNDIDIFVGSKCRAGVTGVICTVDLLKNDTEIKIMYNCTQDEIDSVLSLLNGKYMSGIFIPNEQNPKERELYPVRNSVKALIIHENKLLCIGKSDKDGPYYILPGGGQEKNETFIETVKRECQEELGAEINVKRLKYIREYIGKNHEFAGNDDIHQVEYMFECTLLTQPDETKANQIDDGQNCIQWIDITNHEPYRVYPRVLMERLKSKYSEIYWCDVN